MTSQPLELDQRMQKALKDLFGEQPYNFTDDEGGYLDRLAALRKTDPARARQIQRELRPLEARAFPRVTVPWQDTSEGLRCRLLALSQNPHLEADIATIRRVLGIGPEMLHGNEPWGLKWKRPRGLPDAIPWTDVVALSDREKVRQVVRRNRAVAWMSIHRRAARDEVADADIHEAMADRAGLPRLAVEAALLSAHVTLRDRSYPPWLREATGRESPFDDAILRLCVRHRLPSARNGIVASRVALHVLTADVELLEGVDLALVLPQLSNTPAVDGFELTVGGLDESITHEDAPAVNGFALTVGGLDEFITREDWKRVYEYWVAPRQERLMKMRASRPQGRVGPDIPALIEALPMYRRKVREKLTGQAAFAWEQSHQTQIGRKLKAKAAAERLRALRLLLQPR